MRRLEKEMSNKDLHFQKIWVIGGGRFGQIAIKRITKFIKGAEITLIDKKALSLEYSHLKIVQKDGVRWVDAMLKAQKEVDFIIPAFPEHFMVEWLKLQLSSCDQLQPVEIKDKWLELLPHPYLGIKGRVYVSHADFLCPDACREPELNCTVTGKPRPENLFSYLEKLEDLGMERIVIRSHQLLPGVGGIYPSDLWNVHRKILRLSGDMVMLGTACRCHGVVDFVGLNIVNLPHFRKAVI